MKRLIAILLIFLMLCGCGAHAATPSETEEVTVPVNTPVKAEPVEIPYESRFSDETLIQLSDDGVTATGANSAAVSMTNDIVYYEDKDAYESGNPYGEGSAADKHTAEEAEMYTVVNITAPGAYRVTGKLSYGQIRVDLGDDAYDDKTAVVELILDNADITCTVAPAVLFLNVYECDGAWSEEAAKADVDTSAAGANLILAGENTVNGAYVARIYKDREGEKKLWKQDGAIYSYMSMNVFGPGSLELNAENEGMDTELHLTINGGEIVIRSGNDGINTNEDNVSVTTINGGSIHILAGLGAEGDGIDSNGYLVINGGTVISAAHPAADAGLDSDRGSFVNGGTVIALGSTMDWAESDSQQVTMNLQFAQNRKSTDAIVITKEDGTEVFSYDPASDPLMGDSARNFMGAVISCAEFKVGESYLVYVGGQQMQYTSTDVRRGPGGMGGFGGGRPDNMPAEGFNGQMPEGFDGQFPADMELPEIFGGEMPEGWTPGGMGQRPEGQLPEGMESFEGTFKDFEGKMPEGFSGEMPENFEGFTGQMPEGFGGGNPMGGGRGDFGGFPGNAENGSPSGEGNTLFYMQDKVNTFSGITEVK